MIPGFERTYVISLSRPEVSSGVSAIRRSSTRSTRAVRLLSSSYAAAESDQLQSRRRRSEILTKTSDGTAETV
jgi:hypothetical protein